MIGKLQSERIARVERLKNILRKIAEKKKKVNHEEFIDQIISTFKVNRQTAREYIKQAQYEIKNRI